MFTEVSVSIRYFSTLFFLLFIMASIINMGRLLGKNNNFVTRGKRKGRAWNTLCKCVPTLKCILKSCLYDLHIYVYFINL